MDSDTTSDDTPRKSPSPGDIPKGKGKTKGSLTNTKTIEVNGGKGTRIAQACDRCRAKKTKCDGKRPCSNCDSIGIKCIVSDKLSRRAFPKGYTETLEERIRQLEAENNRLSGIIDLRDEQIKTFKDADVPKQEIDIPQIDRISTHHSHDDGCPCGCTNPNSVHERPVSIISGQDDDHGPLSITDSLNLSDEDETNSLLSTDDELISNSLGSILLERKRNRLYSNKFNDGPKPAPGAFAAATAIEKMQKDPNSKLLFDKQQMLTALVAASIPRSTEETLFVPTMLASICQVYGYDSKPAILAANAIGSLKENSNEVNSNGYHDKNLDDDFLRLIMNKKSPANLTPTELGSFLLYIQLPQSKVEMDHFLTVYFQDWGATLPILNKASFLNSYTTLVHILETGSPSSEPTTGELVEKFGAIMVLVLALSFLSRKHDLFNSTSTEAVGKYVTVMKHYDYLIHEFIRPNCLITETCSILSLQILTLSLQYCLAIGDVSTCFVLRGRVITMAQQLRLHRCPAAVLGVSGNSNDDTYLRNLRQGERRILFWCTYCLDVYCSLNLGVPRLLKDYEIECALPFAGKTSDDDEEENVNILIVNNTRLTIVGKVSRISLSFMLYCKVLGGILDGIYSSSQASSEQQTALNKERELDVWRRELPDELKFEMDLNGFSLKSELSDHWKAYGKQQLCLIFLYFHARILIYLPIISKFGDHHDVALSTKEKLNRGDRNKTSIVSSITMIQQSSLQILEILKVLFEPFNSSLLPIPMNIPREHLRLTLLVAKGALDYIKGGSLYLNSKLLLLSTIPLLIRESKYDVPGGLTKNSAKLVEMAILSILGLPQSKGLMLNKKKSTNSPLTRTAVERGPSSLSNTVFSSNNFLPDRLAKAPQFSESKNEVDHMELINDLLEEGNEIENIFEFDPFKVNLSQNLLINEFAADGSLGLVPFLNNKEEELDFDPSSFEAI